MPTTSPDSIVYPDTSYTGGFVAAIAALATSIQTAFSKRGLHNYQWADATARAAQTGMAAGDQGLQSDTLVIYRYNGSAWKEWISDWITYTPTVTGPTSLGTSSVVFAQYQYQQGRMRVKGRITLGTSPTFDSSPILTLPVTFATLVRFALLGNERCFAFDTSAATTPVAFVARHNGTTYNQIILSPWSGSAATTLNTTTPFTWAVNDTIDFDFVGDPA
jgi:hypothetical protein